MLHLLVPLTFLGSLKEECFRSLSEVVARAVQDLLDHVAEQQFHGEERVVAVAGRLDHLVKEVCHKKNSKTKTKTCDGGPSKPRGRSSRTRAAGPAAGPRPGRHPTGATATERFLKATQAVKGLVRDSRREALAPERELGRPALLQKGLQRQKKDKDDQHKLESLKEAEKEAKEHV